MLKRFSVFLTVYFLLMFPLAAYGNVIFRYSNFNDFFRRHRNEFVRLNINFYANNEGGVSIKREPGSEEVVGVFEHNSLRNISYVFNHEGEYWGFMEGHRYIFRPFGWVPMSQLLMRYDALAFYSLHRDEFYPFAGNIYEELKAVERVVFWSWPGSGIVSNIIDTEAVKSRVLFSSGNNTYRDKHGREWVRATIGVGVGFWACISDPANDAIPAFNPPGRVPWPPQPRPASGQQSVEAGNPQSGSPVPLLALTLVTLLSLGTAVLIRVFWKPEKRQLKQ